MPREFTIQQLKKGPGASICAWVCLVCIVVSVILCLEVVKFRKELHTLNEKYINLYVDYNDLNGKFTRLEKENEMYLGYFYGKPK